MRPTWQTTTTSWLASVDAVPGGSHNRRFWTARQRPRQGSAGVELIWAAGPESQLYLIVARAIFAELRLPGAARVGAVGSSFLDAGFEVQRRRRDDRITDRYHVLRSPRLSRANPRVFSRCRNSQSSSRNDAFVLALGAGRHQPCDAVTP